MGHQLKFHLGRVINHFPRACNNTDSITSNYTLIEASSLDQIKMTKNRLDFDRKSFTRTNINIGT